MIRNILNILFSLLLFIVDSPVYSIDFAPKAIESYTLRISRKFSNTYCNSIKFGISKDGALNFSIGETNKEFSNNKLNKFVDYELLNKNILLSLEKNCQIFDFSEDELENLAFRY
tara:strand:- start:749 stop:1093 length:345 start_codon:yes stop_codon:yes gene_type:complete